MTKSLYFQHSLFNFRKNYLQLRMYFGTLSTTVIEKVPKYATYSDILCEYMVQKFIKLNLHMCVYPFHYTAFAISGTCKVGIRKLV